MLPNPTIRNFFIGSVSEITGLAEKKVRHMASIGACFIEQ
jgi:hypothetical protein